MQAYRWIEDSRDEYTKVMLRYTPQYCVERSLVLLMIVLIGVYHSASGNDQLPSTRYHHCSDMVFTSAFNDHNRLVSVAQ